MRVAVKTSGCRLNRAESRQYEAEFAAAGCELVSFGAECEVVLLHTCVVTATAQKECLRLIRAQRKKNPHAFLVLSGCASEIVPDAKLQELGVDLVIKRADKEQAAALILQKTGWGGARSADGVLPVPDASTARALLKVQDGCDFFCTYCIVPYTRGAPRSVPLEKCLTSARCMIDSGFNELVVTGCNLACYNSEGSDLAGLLAHLVRLPGLGRLRLSALEPGTVELKIARLMAESDKICHFLHLPVQSADDQVLRLMGRRYTISQIEQRIAEILRLVPDIGLGSDLITGFPGESATAFRRTLQWIKNTPFNNLHVFPYSERPGTPAAGFANSLPKAERRQRARQLIEVGHHLRHVAARRRLAQPAVMLVERVDTRGVAYGWSGDYLPCVLRGAQPDVLHRLLDFTPTQVRDATLYGALV